MPVFEIETPDGTFEVDAPDEQTAMGALRSMPAGGTHPEPSGPESDASRNLRGDLSAMTQNPSKAEYDALPEWQKPIVAASDIVQKTANGLLLNQGDELAAAMRAPFTDKTYSEELANQERLSNAASRRSGGAGTVAELAGGIKTALNVPSFGGSAIASGQGLGRAAVGSAADGALLGAVMGAGEQGGLEDRAQSALTGAKWGIGTGLAAPYVAAGGSKLLEKIVSPFATSAERAAAAEILKREGVQTTAGQQTGSKALRYAEGEIGGAKAADMMEIQGEQFTKAALKRAGIDATRATPEVIDEAFTRIGAQFDDLASRNVLKPDKKLVEDLRGAFNEYGSLVPPTSRAPVVESLANDIVAAFRSKGQISGEAYQALRSRLDRMARATKADPNLSNVLRDMRSALDNGMERSLIMTRSPDVGAWRQVRREYRNMLVLEDAATRAGENAALGLISPSSLRSATKTKQGARNYARGDGDFADLARSGEAIMKPLPDSGTASRLNARNLAAFTPSVVGAGAGGYYGGQNGGGLSGAIAGMIGGVLAPKAVGQMMMSKAGQRYLANQLMRGGMTPEKRAILAQLLTFTGASEAPALAP